MMAALGQGIEGDCVEEGGWIRAQSRGCVAGVQGQAGPSELADCRGDRPGVAGQSCQMERFIVYRMAKGHGSWRITSCSSATSHEQEGRCPASNLVNAR